MSVWKTGEGVEGEGPGGADAQGVEKGAQAGREGSGASVPEDRARVDGGPVHGQECPRCGGHYAGQLRIEELALLMRPVPKLAEGEVPMREESPDPKVEQAAGSGARISRRGGQASNRRQAGTEDDPGVSHEGADHQLELGLLSCAC